MTGHPRPRKRRSSELRPLRLRLKHRQNLMIKLPLLVVVLLSPAAALRAGAPAARPNILIAISDDQSHRHTSAAGYKAVNTPAFDRVAREGVLFLNGFAASPGCSPSRAALLTGRHPWQIEQAGTHGSSFPAKYVAFPELLEQSGRFHRHDRQRLGPGIPPGRPAQTQPGRTGVQETNRKDPKERREDFTSEFLVCLSAFLCVPLRFPFPPPNPAPGTTSKISKNPNTQVGTSAFGLNSVPFGTDFLFHPRTRIRALHMEAEDRDFLRLPCVNGLTELPSIPSP
jgi:hypothetical protein